MVKFCFKIVTVYVIMFVVRRAYVSNVILNTGKIANVK